MDFGLDKLIEMIEERFGKLAANSVLLAVTIGAGAWGIHSFFALFALPLFRYGAKFFDYLWGSPPKIWAPIELAVLLDVATVGLAAILMIALATIIRHRFNRYLAARIEERRQQVAEDVEGGKRQLQDLYNHYDADLKSREEEISRIAQDAKRLAETAKNLAEGSVKESHEITDKFQAKLDAILSQGESDGPQSPQDTQSKTPP